MKFKKSISSTLIISSLLFSSCQQHRSAGEIAIDIVELPIKIVAAPLLVVGLYTAKAAESITDFIDDHKGELNIGKKRLILIGKKFTAAEDMPIYQFQQHETSYCLDQASDEDPSSNSKQSTPQDQLSTPVIATLPKGTLFQVVKISSENPENIEFPYKVFIQIDNPEWKDRIVDATPLFKDKIQKALEKGYNIDETPILHL